MNESPKSLLHVEHGGPSSGARELDKLVDRLVTERDEALAQRDRLLKALGRLVDYCDRPNLCLEGDSEFQELSAARTAIAKATGEDQ